jgi:hypothetical protein
MSSRGQVTMVARTKDLSFEEINRVDGDAFKENAFREVPFAMCVSFHSMGFFVRAKQHTDPQNDNCLGNDFLKYHPEVEWFQDR